MKANVLAIALTLPLAGSASAALTLVGGAPTAATDDPVTGNTLFENVMVQAGDLVVISTAVNKRASQNLLTGSWTGGANGIAATTAVEQIFASYLFTYQINVGGTYSFAVNASNSSLTANSAFYHLRADSGSISLAGSNSLTSASAGAAALSYSFGTPISGGIAIEAASTRDGDPITVDSNYSLVSPSGANGGRLIAYREGVSGASLSSSHSMAVAGDIATLGAVYIEQVPEPSRIVLILAGATGLIVRRRRSI